MTRRISSPLAVAWDAWARSVAAGARFYNGSLDETLWLLASGAILLVGTGRLWGSQRPGGRAGAVLLGVLLAGHLAHYLFPPAGLDAPGAVRWAELIALPAAMLLLYQRAQAWPVAQPPITGACQWAMSSPQTPVAPPGIDGDGAGEGDRDGLEEGDGCVEGDGLADADGLADGPGTRYVTSRRGVRLAPPSKV